MPMVARWKTWLTKDPDFRRWYENNSRSSDYTGREYARTLYRLLKRLDHTSSSIIELAKKDNRTIKNLMLDFITEQAKGNGKEKPKAPSYLDNYIKVINSWLVYNDLAPIKNIKIGNKNLRPTLETERVPEKRELKQIFNYARTRGRVSIALIAFSGLRPQVMGNRTGTDGLKLKDLPELRIEDDQVVFDEMSIRLDVRHELSKNKSKYSTFLGPEGCDYLKAYLEMRLADGEVFTPESAVITYKAGYIQTGYDQDRDSPHITTKTLTKEIREAFRPKYKWRPYVLRSYFSTQLLVAENHGKISHPYRQYFMGHKGNIEAVYSTNKSILPDHVIADMRQSYNKCLEYLETSTQHTNEDRIREEFRNQLLLVAGYTSEEIESMDMNLDDEDFQKTIRSKLVGSMVNNGHPQKIVSINDLEEFMNKGWEYVAKISDDKVIIKLS